MAKGIGMSIGELIYELTEVAKKATFKMDTIVLLKVDYNDVAYIEDNGGELEVETVTYDTDQYNGVCILKACLTEES